MVYREAVTPHPDRKGDPTSPYGRGETEFAVRSSSLPVPSIDRHHRKFCKLDAVDAADVQRHHFGAVGLAAAREHVDAAVDAELVPDRVPVEHIFLQIVLAGAELKT